MFGFISRLFTSCIPRAASRAEDDASVLMIGEASSPFYSCLQIDSPFSLLFFRVRLSDAAAERDGKINADMHPTGVVRAYTFDHGASYNSTKQAPVHQSVRLATTLPRMRISDLYPLGDLRLKDGEHLDALSTWLVHVCIEEMRHREASVSVIRGSGKGNGVNGSKARMTRTTDNAVLAKAFVAAEAARKEGSMPGNVGLVSIARIAMQRSVQSEHGPGWAA